MPHLPVIQARSSLLEHNKQGLGTTLGLPNVSVIQRIQEGLGEHLTSFSDPCRQQVLHDPRSLTMNGWQQRVSEMSRKYQQTHTMLRGKGSPKHLIKPKLSKICHRGEIFQEATVKELALLSRELQHIGDINPAYDREPVRIQTNHPFKYKVGQLFEQVLSTGQCIRGIVRRVEKHAVPPHYVEVDVSGISSLEERQVLAYTFRTCLESVKVLDERLEVAMTLAEKDLQMLHQRTALEDSIIAARATYDLDRLEKETNKHEFVDENLQKTVLKETEQLLENGVKKKQKQAQVMQDDLDLFVALVRRYGPLSPSIFTASIHPGCAKLRQLHFSAIKLQRWLLRWHPVRFQITSIASRKLQKHFRAYRARKEYRRLQENIQRSKRFMVRILLQRKWQVWNRWCIYTSRTVRLRKFAMKISSRTVCLALESWKQYTRDRIEGKKKALSQFIARWQLKNLAKPFLGWVHFIRTRKSAREISRRMFLRQKALVFKAWLAFVASKTNAKVSQVVQVQKLWRGFSCRNSLLRQQVLQKKMRLKVALWLQARCRGYLVRSHFESIKVLWLCRKREAARFKRREARKKEARLKRKLRAKKSTRRKLLGVNGEAAPSTTEFGRSSRSGYYSRTRTHSRRNMVIPAKDNDKQMATMYMEELQWKWKKQVLVAGPASSPAKAVKGAIRRLYHFVAHGNTRGAAMREFRLSAMYLSGETLVCPRCKKVNRKGRKSRLNHLKNECQGYSVVLRDARNEKKKNSHTSPK